MSDGKVRGVVHLIEETKSYGQKGFRKRLVVLQQDTRRFVNYIPVEFTNDGCDTVNDLHVGDTIEVNFRLSGRKWQKDMSSEVKFFLSAEATSYKVVGDDPRRSVADANAELADAAASDDDSPF